MRKILVTGAAGFIGYHMAQALLDSGEYVVGLDNLNDYYSVDLKRARLDAIQSDNFEFVEGDLARRELLEGLFEQHQFERVVNLAAQAGVRYSLENPAAYIDCNLVGFANLLECCRHHKTGHLLYASSSSVYGANKKQPFSVEHSVDHPVSLYAATKKANELLAHSYSHLYMLPTTGLRFFTVYGPWGRPDMAAYLFTKAIFEDKPIKVFNHGKMQRDFTYVDDIVEAMVRLVDYVAKPDPDFDVMQPSPQSSYCPYRVFNIGNNQPVELGRFIEVLESAIGKEAEKDYMPLQPGDVISTFADVNALEKAIDFKPETSIESGVGKFVDWYREYHQID
ncbi:MAG: NAD-dependent epimerase [Planctomycetota bacterium]